MGLGIYFQIYVACYFCTCVHFSKVQLHSLFGRRNTLGFRKCLSFSPVTLLIYLSVTISSSLTCKTRKKISWHPHLPQHNMTILNRCSVPLLLPLVLPPRPASPEGKTEVGVGNAELHQAARA